MYHPYSAARDEVHTSLCCLLIVPHLARRLPARRAVFAFFFEIVVAVSSILPYEQPRIVLQIAG